MITKDRILEIIQNKEYIYIPNEVLLYSAIIELHEFDKEINIILTTIYWGNSMINRNISISLDDINSPDSLKAIQFISEKKAKIILKKWKIPTKQSENKE